MERIEHFKRKEDVCWKAEDKVCLTYSVEVPDKHGVKSQADDVATVGFVLVSYFFLHQ